LAHGLTSLWLLLELAKTENALRWSVRSLAAMVSDRRGRPFGLPEKPGLKLVERLATSGHLSGPACYLACFLADPVSGLNREPSDYVTANPI
jgi:hypothetical protein